MILVQTVQELRLALGATGSGSGDTGAGMPGGLPGFVPTMGYLHQGHLFLARQAKAECGLVVLSIFVNPTQFGPGEDLKRYPRNLEGDKALCRQSGVDILWLPQTSDLYPEGLDQATYVECQGPALPLEGQLRPGHFRGVSTVVTKLLNGVGLCRLYLGQKDAQQVAVLRHTLQTLLMPQEIRVCPIVRESDGLAMSSRNAYLDPSWRARAPAIHQGLQAALAAWREGETDPEVLEALAATAIRTTGLDLQYVKAVEGQGFDPVVTVQEGNLLCAAAFAGSTRLIDNIIFSRRTP